ncbi:hypothetical protein [Roseitranquillus sediminis]|uniref:hypothetical protein n=1 Tax=Roseitranquillus sediminis TaxID=2809051 RepID=UPI001D0C06A3|nr:hypothetical protein [Roseitranquillus sediminis]MBM9595101.1 hypothetical protein [Roseitranquillus sediminis]
MLRLARSTVALSLAALLTVGLGSGASAADYDMDCKLILCLPAGFPEGCGDALDHMVDRLRDGKPPIGFCAMSDGSEFNDYDLDYRWLRAESSAAWACPDGKRLRHSVSYDGESDGRREVTAFCYDTSATRRFGDGHRSSYTGVTEPVRSDFEARMQISPDTSAAWDSGILRAYTGRVGDWRTTIRTRP